MSQWPRWQYAYLNESENIRNRIFKRKWTHTPSSIKSKNHPAHIAVIVNFLSFRK
jgi:hypothetical protein